MTTETERAEYERAFKGSNQTALSWSAFKAGFKAGRAHPVQAFQGGLTNDELRAAFTRKLPNVEPSDRDLSVFALGIEVGAGGGVEWEWYQLEGIGMVRRRKSDAGVPEVDERQEAATLPKREPFKLNLPPIYDEHYATTQTDSGE
jgi:hypothetical protein